MSLKTLKDFEYDMRDVQDEEIVLAASVELLKEEAIKHIKEENKRWCEALQDKGNIPISPRNIKLIEFLNIAEEDLMTNEEVNAREHGEVGNN